MSQPRTLRELSCADDYDPDSMPVDTARTLIRQFLTPVGAIERVHVRASLSRVLAEDVVSPVDVPGHDNSAMDGYAVRFADVVAGEETTLRRVGESFAGKPPTVAVGPGECVRIFTGGVMPAGADTVVMQERASEAAGRVSDRRRRGQQGRTEPALRRRGSQARSGGFPCAGSAYAPPSSG